MRLLWPSLVMSVSGCSSILGIDDFKLTDGGTVADGPGIDASAGCLGPQDWRVCLAVLPTMPLTLNMALLDTDTSPVCRTPTPPSWTMQGQSDACIVAATTISVQTLVRVTGARPLVLVATDRIDVAMGLDGAGREFTDGPGVAIGACGQPQPAGDNLEGGGGGAGGSFGTLGGNGGNVDANGVIGGRAAPAAVTPQTRLRGGCPGAPGGEAQPPTQSIGGGAGGAIYLLAGNAIEIGGFVNVSGAGGLVGGRSSGGGGGGSGGMIVVHAPAFAGRGVLIANGGGGGGGQASVEGATAGGDPNPQMPLAPARGGDASFSPGGSGFAGSTAATNGTNGNASTLAGGGGGGGGGGFIRANARLGVVNGVPGMTVSPPETVIP